MERARPRFLDSPLSFEQWLRRPVYVVQCRTWKMACDMGVQCVLFRALPGYRDAEAALARRIVAQAVLIERVQRDISRVESGGRT